MNRSLGLIAAALSVLLLAGCAPKSAPPAKTPAVAAPPAAGSPTTPAPAAASTSPAEDAEPAVAPPVVLESTKGSGGWCDAGQTYRDANQEYKVTGLVQFKGKTYCEAVVTKGAGTSKLYYNQDQSDQWLVTTAGGKTVEFHIPNGN